MERGKFIVLEGIDGAGTTTQAQLLRSWLQDIHGKRVLLTQEPSSLPTGNMISSMLKRRIVAPHGQGDPNVDPRAVALLFASDRLYHLQEEIMPAIAQGYWVISDRYLASSLAYQSIYCDMDWVAEINKFADSPDLSFYLNLSAEIAMKRIGTRANKDHFERLDLLTRVSENYRAIREDMDFVSIDANLDVQTIAGIIQETIASVCGLATDS